MRADSNCNGERMHGPSSQRVDAVEPAPARLGRKQSCIGGKGGWFSPTEVEEVLRRHPAVREAVVFSRPSSTHHVKAGYSAPNVTCIAVAARPGVPLPTLTELRAFGTPALPLRRLPKALVVVDAIPKDSNGQPSRSKLEQLCHKLNVPASRAAESPGATAMLELVLGAARGLIPGVEVDSRTPLMDAGIDSVRAGRFAAELERLSGVELTPLIVFQFGTAEGVARHLQSERSLPRISRESHLQAAPTAARLPSDGAAVAAAGFAAQWPGGTTHELFTISHASGDGMSEIPARRWNAYGIEFLRRPQLSSMRYGGFLRSADRFDASCFRISRIEAATMDPQQRMLLEAGYSSFVGAGWHRAALMGSGMGVCVGIMNVDFAAITAQSQSVFVSTCSMTSVAAGRLSFTLGLQGPCHSVDTACSSALVSVHQVALQLHMGDDCALAASVNLILTHTTSGVFARANMLSDDGHCKT